MGAYGLTIVSLTGSNEPAEAPIAINGIRGREQIVTEGIIDLCRIMIWTQ